MKWISIKENLPPLNTWVLVYFQEDYDGHRERKYSVHKMYERLTGDWETEEEKKDLLRWTCICQVTHWMLLPEAPIKE